MMDVRFQHSNRQVDMQKPLNFKLVLLGESAVGKSSMWVLSYSLYLSHPVQRATFREAAVRRG